jgi:hypothetical protein
MGEPPGGVALDGKQAQWNYIPPKWWRVTIAVVPFAVFAEAVALLIAFEPHPKLPTSQIWGVAFSLGIPAPLFWLRNGNRHFRNLIAYKTIDPAMLNLIAYFSVGILAACYLLVALLIENLYLALRLAR